MGFAVSVAIRLLMLRVAAGRRLPFDVRVPAPGTVEAMQDLDPGEEGRFVTADELLADPDIRSRRRLFGRPDFAMR
jgi:antitoxin component of RelBE/YafQ-DinJ toxin-antitoxin module